MSRKETMQRVRTQVLLIRRLSAQMRELSRDGLRSMRMDGMPRAGGMAQGLDAKMLRREALEGMLQRECRKLREWEREARREMDGMSPERYAFCSMYYIGAFSMEETAQALDRTVRQCRRYKAEIEGESYPQNWGENVRKCPLVSAGKV